MYVHRTNNGKRIPQFTCSNYSKIPVGSLCPTQHRINGDVVMTLVKETLKELITFSKEDEEEFVRLVKETVASKQDSSAKEKEYRLDSLKKRSAELEKLLCRIYEDNILGKLFWTQNIPRKKPRWIRRSRAYRSLWTDTRKASGRQISLLNWCGGIRTLMR